MEWPISIIFIGLMVGGFFVSVKLIKPFIPKLRRWMAAHGHGTELVLSLVIIVWGAAIWYLLISQNNYSNIPAMIAASFLICAGTFFFIVRLRNKPGGGS